MQYNLATELDQERFVNRANLLLQKGVVVELTEKTFRSPNQNRYLHLLIGVIAMDTGVGLDYAKREYFKKTQGVDLTVECVLEKNVERAKKITKGLQKQDLANCYICPLTAFSHLRYKEIGYEQEMALCFDLLQICDTLIVASEISHGVQMEIDLANKLLNADGEPMEVIYLEHN